MINKLLCASSNHVMCCNERIIRCMYLRGTRIKSFLLIESYYQFLFGKIKHGNQQTFSNHALVHIFKNCIAEI